MKLPWKIKMVLVTVSLTVAILAVLCIPFEFLSFSTCSSAYAVVVAPEPSVFGIVALIGAYFGLKK